jgi:nucleoside-diphosphate-sugar epimerase
MHQVSSPDQLNTSVQRFYEVIKAAPPKTEKELISSPGSFADVRDVANAHVKALTVENAGGKRFIISTGWSVSSGGRVCALKLRLKASLYGRISVRYGVTRDGH